MTPCLPRFQMPEISTGTREGRWECRHRPPDGRCTRQDSPPPTALTIEGDAWRGALLLGRGVPSQAPQRGAASGKTLLLPLPTLLRAMQGEAPYRCKLLGRGVPSQAPQRGRCTRQGSPPPNAITRKQKVHLDSERRPNRNLSLQALNTYAQSCQAPKSWSTPNFLSLPTSSWNERFLQIRSSRFKNYFVCDRTSLPR